MTWAVILTSNQNPNRPTAAKKLFYFTHPTFTMPVMNITDELLDQLEELEREWVKHYEEEYLGWGMRVKSDSKSQFVVSEPPSGYKKITNIYYNPDVGGGGV